jgi:GYF domain 2
VIDWYFAVDGSPLGPLAHEELIAKMRAGVITAQTPCWHSQLTQWVPLASVVELAALLATATARPEARPKPPPLPVAPAGARAPSPKRRLSRPARPQFAAFTPPPLVLPAAATPDSLSPADRKGTANEGDAVRIDFDFAFDGHYDVLGIPRNADEKAVKLGDQIVNKIYDRAARNGDARATKITALARRAGSLLSHPERRAAYDRTPEAVFLNTEEPVPEETVSLADGLELIREQTLSAGDVDPVERLRNAGLDERPNTMLDALLRGDGA